jgi:hypothetical protein
MTDRSRRVEGTVTRYNKKTVTVIADDGRRWTVSPHLLQPATPKKVGPDMRNVTPRTEPPERGSLTSAHPAPERTR